MTAHGVSHKRVSLPTDGMDSGTHLRLVSTDGTYFAGYVGRIGVLLIRRILADHYCNDPTELWASVIAYTSAEAETLACISGRLAEVADDALVFADGTRIAADDIVSIEI